MSHMSSTLACVGLDVASAEDLGPLLDATVSRGSRVAVVDGRELWRWQDDSGARLALTLRGSDVVHFVPSFAGVAGTRLSAVRRLDSGLADVDVVDDDGEMTTRLAVELEEQEFLHGEMADVGPSSVVALGVDMAVYQDADAYDNADASLLGGSEGDESTETEDRPRFAAESVISYALFAGGGDMAAAHLAGTVVAASGVRHTHTGQSFTVARVRLLCMELDVCLAGDRAVAAGNTIAGTAVLVGSVPSVLTTNSTPERRRLGRWLHR